MTGDTTVIQNLQVSAKYLAHLVAQYDLDVRQLKSMKLGGLEDIVKKWLRHTEKQYHKFMDRLLFYNTEPNYEVGIAAGADNVEDILHGLQSIVSGALELFIEYRKVAYDKRADYTPDIYEHAIEELEKQGFEIEQELSILSLIGLEAYIESRLE